MNPIGRSWRRFLAPYWLVNAAMVAAYFPIMSITEPWEADAPDVFPVQKETQTVICILLMSATSFMNQPTWEAFWTQNLFYAKAGVWALLILENRYVGILYMLACAIVSFVVEMPTYKGADTVKYLGESEFKAQVENDSSKKFFLAEFYASWSPPCRLLEPLFADLAHKYSSENMEFVKVDVVRHSRLATRYRINTDGSSKQLPTVILFQNGKELLRLPSFSKGGVLTRGPDSRDLIVSFFDLEKRSAVEEKSDAAKSKRSKKTD